MSPFDRRPWLRWTVPVGTATLLVAGATLAPLGAVADSPLPARSAEELLVALQEPSVEAVSGTVAMRTDLGLPDLPMGMMPSAGPLALLDGESTLRVWTDGPDRARLALIERAGETTLVRNGSEVWVWSSAEASADRYELPEMTGTDGARLADKDLPEGVELPSTPQEAAEMALEALDPSTEVTTSGAATAAGRDAYELILTPRDDLTSVDRVVIAMDAETNVPLRVRVFATTMQDPAVDVGYTSVDYGTPDPGLFEFTPPPGATVTEHPTPSLTDDQKDDLAARAEAADASGRAPTVVGAGWSTIVVADLPADGLADLAEAGQAGPGPRGHSGGADPAATALALLEALPATSGDWGTGRVLKGTLFSAIVTDDGRIALGAVSPDALGAALASAR